MFQQQFRAVQGNVPFPWQERLFRNHFLCGDIPSALDIPTGLGKTSVIAVWLLTLAWQAERRAVKIPRRLIYVVDRRTVVDQATDVAERLRASLMSAPPGSLIAQIRDQLSKLCIKATGEASPLAISTLRGERADNREWQADPARPAIIIGTVDMIGSRLLFSGYGVSCRMRPFHAGLLGQDTLLVHDEAHLSEPFAKLIRGIAEVQHKQNEPHPLRVMELSATQRQQGATAAFTLTKEDKAEDLVDVRLNATKRLSFEGSADSEDAVIAKIVALALRYRDKHKRVLVYVRRPRDARRIADELAKATDRSRVALLTGILRGYERDALAETSLFTGFRSDPDRQPPEATEYLVATSAGEVGVDLDADHLVCDLTTLDSMIQRLGRVNRLGGREAEISVVGWPKDKGQGKRKSKAASDEAGETDTEGGKKDDGESDLDKRIAATKAALASLPKRDGAHDASPESLRALANRTDAFAPTPRTVELTDILIDNWALTRVKDLPGRPLPERWLHGIETGEPDLYVAWREEVSELAACLRDDNWNSVRILKQLYDKHPILARERLRGPLSEVKRDLERIAKRKPKAAESEQGDSEDREPPQPFQAILLPVNGDPIVGALSDLLEREAALPYATIVLPPSAGGLDERGMLTSEARYDPARTPPYDVADDLAASGRDERRRLRVLLTREPEAEGWSARVIRQAIAIPDELVAQSVKQAARAIRTYFALAERALLVFDRDEEGEPARALLLLGESRAAATAQDDPAGAARQQDLDEHLSWAEQEAEKIIARTGLEATAPDVADAVVIAARWHDRGKNRPAWQKAIGHAPPRRGENADWKPWAKSGQRDFDDSECGAYRHEFGSLREASEDETIRGHPERDLILHLIAAHHGWARPHFEPDQWDIADGVSDEKNEAIAAETMRRFARLQRRFGHWGLAWLESLIRAADYSATERLGSNGNEAAMDLRERAT
ncbi:type I-U CRISPR-associated helicase/endonuclease Cas3 [Pseudorhodoplanes sp.]|uniref:type I-G CRISPR-associated helicase/endonuclease Cas3g n=1 Tax=Pseudorhodoplanes sp. TaxID=1934341 RepID=UPI00391D5EA8